MLETQQCVRGHRGEMHRQGQLQRLIRCLLEIGAVPTGGERVVTRFLLHTMHHSERALEASFVFLASVDALHGSKPKEQGSGGNRMYHRGAVGTTIQYSERRVLPNLTRKVRSKI